MLTKLTNTVAAAGICTSLSACSPQEAAATVDQVQAATVAACGFLPTAQTILAVFETHPVVMTASALASGFCAVVMKKGSAHWTYNGVRVEGRFVR